MIHFTPSRSPSDHDLPALIKCSWGIVESHKCIRCVIAQYTHCRWWRTILTGLPLWNASYLEVWSVVVAIVFCSHEKLIQLRRWCGPDARQKCSNHLFNATFWFWFFCSTSTTKFTRPSKRRTTGATTLLPSNSLTCTQPSPQYYYGPTTLTEVQSHISPETIVPQLQSLSWCPIANISTTTWIYYPINGLAKVVVLIKWRD